MDNLEKHESSKNFSVDRRELMKLGAGTVLSASLTGPVAAAQEGADAAQRSAPPPHSMRAPGEIAPFTGAGYKNDFNRLGQNGPMDDTTRKIVRFVHDFDESLVTPAVVDFFNRTMIDSIASLIAGFEYEAPRILARMASQLYPAGREKCTILGYGVTTTPEMAAFANATLIRETDFNDNVGSGSHVSTLIPAAFAMGEALHKTGREVMMAICMGYELTSAPADLAPIDVAGGSPVAAAMMAGRLMGLDEDHLANALSLSMISYPPRGAGALNMYKSVSQSIPVQGAVFSALYAREGMTCNPQPFEGEGARWARGANLQPNGMGPEFTLPTRPGRLEIEWNHWFKRRPSEANTQGILLLIPEIREWVGNPNDIASFHWDYSLQNWGETGDAAKWDPRNRQTADHSWPYVFSRALLDGDIYMDSYTEEKLMDPAVRAVMEKLTLAPVLGWTGNGGGRLTITKKTGETKYWDTYDGERIPSMAEYKPMTNEELKAKFDRVCAFRKVTDAQRDQAYKVWNDLSSLKDFADAMKVLAKFGQPKPL